ncbi:hypothetical protein QFZ83_003782 [Variovorax sp. W1I1]|nr:hypothetical protein [Variovorax sp. W1I1]
MLDVAAAITTCGVFDCVASARGGQRGRRDAEASDHVHLVVDDEFLCEALGDVGRGHVVLDDQLDLLAGHGVAVLRHVKARRGFDLPAGGGLLPGHRQDEADLEGVALRAGQRQCEGGGERDRREARGLDEVASLHEVFLGGTECETGAIFNTLQHSTEQAIT